MKGKNILHEKQSLYVVMPLFNIMADACILSNFFFAHKGFQMEKLRPYKEDFSHKWTPSSTLSCLQIVFLSVCHLNLCCGWCGLTNYAVRSFLTLQFF